MSLWDGVRKATLSSVCIVRYDTPRHSHGVLVTLARDAVVESQMVISW